jgi:hypothetical protein
MRHDLGVNQSANFAHVPIFEGFVVANDVKELHAQTLDELIRPFICSMDRLQRHEEASKTTSQQAEHGSFGNQFIHAHDIHILRRAWSPGVQGSLFFVVLVAQKLLGTF